MAITSVFTWDPTTADYSSPSNWNPAFAPTDPSRTAIFGTSTITGITLPGATTIEVGEWLFSPGASHYSFTEGASTSVRFYGGGILVLGGSAEITIPSGNTMIFLNSSTAGNASIANNGIVTFFGLSTGGTANITNDHSIEFIEYSSAGHARIETGSTGGIGFSGFSNGGDATLVTDTGGIVDFSRSVGPAGDRHLSVGSIAGRGNYYLGSDQLVVGLDGKSPTVLGAIDDGNALGSGTGGGSLVKVGHDTLTLAGVGNTYSGGTTLEGGALDLAALGAAGTGPIAFAGRATLKIENAALSGHVFATNNIDFFAKHDVLDLTGLHFHAGATATYHKASHHLTVHSGRVTDTLTLLAPHGTHFATASDHHGGTDVFLVFA
jgi:autotransporter-associated beta strand protein